MSTFYNWESYSLELMAQDCCVVMTSLVSISREVYLNLDVGMTHSFDIPFKFVKCFVRFFIQKISFTVAPVQFSKINLQLYILPIYIAATRFMTIVGVGTSVNCPRVILFQSVAKTNYMCPVYCLWDPGILPLVSSPLACCLRFCLRVPVRRPQSVAYRFFSIKGFACHDCAWAIFI